MSRKQVNLLVLTCTGNSYRFKSIGGYSVEDAIFGEKLMATEIEHKYLVKAEDWDKSLAHQHMLIKQGYLQTDPEKTVRVRTKGVKGYLTIKGKPNGASRLEFEYEIPFEEAKILLEGFCSNLVEKTRYLVIHEAKLWEVDVFEGSNNGLILAEIELTAEDELYSLPYWIGEEVTHDQRYANSNLACSPFCTW